MGVRTSSLAPGRCPPCAPWRRPAGSHAACGGYGRARSGGSCSSEGADHWPLHIGNLQLPADCYHLSLAATYSPAAGGRMRLAADDWLPIVVRRLAAAWDGEQTIGRLRLTAECELPHAWWPTTSSPRLRTGGAGRRRLPSIYRPPTTRLLQSPTEAKTPTDWRPTTARLRLIAGFHTPLLAACW